MIKMQMAMDNPPFVDDLPFENDLYISVGGFAFERVPAVNTQERSAKRPNRPSHSAGHVFPHQSPRRTWCHVCQMNIVESPGWAFGASNLMASLVYQHLISTCINKHYIVHNRACIKYVIVSDI